MPAARAQIQTAQSGDEHTNHEATAPSKLRVLALTQN